MNFMKKMRYYWKRISMTIKLVNRFLPKFHYIFISIPIIRYQMPNGCKFTSYSAIMLCAYYFITIEVRQQNAIISSKLPLRDFFRIHTMLAAIRIITPLQLFAVTLWHVSTNASTTTFFLPWMLFYNIFQTHKHSGTRVEVPTVMKKRPRRRPRYGAISDSTCNENSVSARSKPAKNAPNAMDKPACHDWKNS